MKVGVYFLVLGPLLSQLYDIFLDSSLAMVKQIYCFFNGGIMNIIHEMETGNEYDKELYEYYNLGNGLIPSKFKTHFNVYKVTYTDTSTHQICYISLKLKRPLTVVLIWAQLRLETLSTESIN